MGHWIDLDTEHGRIAGWYAAPVGLSRGGVVVVQEIFGLNGHIRSVVDRVAAAGFTALAPALFDPVERGVELAYDDAGVARGRQLTAALGFDRALELVSASAEHLQLEGLRTGVVGFCWGGTLSYLSAARLGLPAVDYYGARSVDFLDQRNDGEPLLAPLLCHFGEHDASIPPEAIALHRRKLPGAIIHLYPAGHGFNCDPRRDYHQASAELAWQRSIDFLAENLR
ncbi:dienelactone hydrolase family protein [Montanilutibacter psychrotolerans]|uniref:Dienelactone hydrolase family protein n=1 Tax=Montanilutibacter psychrotolerans TaxID=1327343 RepID=A0A3M8SWG9_9GAMM|nr:dienelactone hydrolase family protein [Lysobacter psychrotolerans]RNF85163.1 dienelactone hydrolase family protein [Lysobacter psychrotolerans]